MLTLALVVSLAGVAPAADESAHAADALDAFARECPAGKPKKRKYDDSTFALALEKLRTTKPEYTPRAWAVTCEYVILCNVNAWDSCPRLYGQPVSGTPVNGGELMILAEVASERDRGRGLYAVRAQDVGKKFGFYNGWALPTHRIAVIDGPPFEDPTR